jgi:hypothetical protein
VADAKQTEPSNPPSLSADAKGLSQFFMRILDQLSLSSWLPATFLVGVSLLLVKIDSQEQMSVSGALADFSRQDVGVLVIVFFGLIIFAMITQAFEFAAIRIPEGYWAHIFSLFGVTRFFVELQRLRRRFCDYRARRLRKRAFRKAREGLLDHRIDYQVLLTIQSRVYGEKPPDDPCGVLAAKADVVRWERYVSPSLMRAVEAADRANEAWPTMDRLMPTRLGNVLRSTEDAIDVGDGSLRTFVIRYWHLLSPEQQLLHNQYRNRLNLYCSMVFVCAALLALGGVLLRAVPLMIPLQVTPPSRLISVQCSWWAAYSGDCSRCVTRPQSVLPWATAEHCR